MINPQPTILSKGSFERLIGVILIVLFSINQGDTQDVTLTNGSFEGYPRLGTFNAFGFRTQVPDGWFDCGVINFPSHTPPDVHPNEVSPIWGVTVPASEGQTYLGMVVRADESWESVSQNLAVNLKAGTCYKFSIDLYRSPDYWSRIENDGSPEVQAILGQQDPTRLHNHITPAVLRLWGGKTFCAEGELLASSKPVDNDFWKRYSFKIEPSFDISHITLEAFYNVPILSPYLGHILVDNASDFTVIECDKPKKDIETIEEIEFEEEELLVELEQDLPPPRNEKRPSKKEVVIKTSPQTQKKDLVQEKILKDLDKKVKEGQIIQVHSLLFKADDYVLDSSSYEVVFEIYDFLASNESIEVEIGGHTNSTPPHSYCDELSRTRAQSVADILIQKGIDEKRIRVKGYGKRKPKHSNSTPLGRKKNQRVELKILKIEYH